MFFKQLKVLNSTCKEMLTKPTTYNSLQCVLFQFLLENSLLNYQIFRKESRIRETLLPCADDSTNTKPDRKRKRRKRKNITCHVKRVACCVLRDICHLSPVTKPTTTATDPPLLTSSLCTVGWFAKTPKSKIVSNYKNH